MPTLSVAIFIHSSKLASKGMTPRFPGVTALPVMSGMSSWSCEGVWGLSWSAPCNVRRGSSRRGAHRVALGFLLCMAADGLFLSVVVERHLDGCLLRRGGRVVLGRARHGGLGCGACDGPGRSVVCLGESARGLARYDHDLPHQRAPECRHPHSQYHGRRAICNPCSHHGNVRDRRPIKHSFRT
jgi:hypothetical protein